VTTVHELSPELQEALAPEFELLRHLGTGSMGTVFLARETELKRLVAIKVPRPELAQDPEVCKRIEREALAAARIRHLSAAEVHRIGHLPTGAPYLVLQYVEGRKLAELLPAEGPFDEGTAVHLLRQVADALAAAHEAGVVHRDVRPDNVFWQESRRLAVLTDFGIAGILESGSEVMTRLTRPGQPLGDPAYRSPEQLLAETVGPPADIYGLGLLGYELLALEGPYPATSRADRAAAHLRAAPRDLEDLVPGTDPRLASLLRRCLAKDPGHRPTAQAVVRELSAIRAGSRRGPKGTRRRPAPGSVEWALEGVPALSRFLAELRRRRVFNVALAYGVLCFVVLQVAVLILPALPLPEWSYEGLVAAALAGFPVAMVLAWMYDLTNAGIQRAESADLGGPGYFRWLLPALGLAVSLTLAGAIGWWVLRGG
jgi:eukaryotic-like serine/threonine-protein kinase